MSTKTLSMIATALALLLLAIGAAGALAGRPERAPAAAAVVSGGISYQGRLTSPSGAPLSGNYTMRFVIYTASVAGTALWDSGNLVVAVDRGLFQVKLGVDPSDFNGQSLWLSIIVNGQTLSPRQEILPAPYALGLRPGVDVVGDAIGAADATFAGYAPATGTALYADANGGVGLFGDSENSYGVWGSSDNSWGGYFTSAQGYGIRVTTNGTDHYDHGAYISSNNGYAVLAQSANNMAVRGEAGNISGISPPLGPVGIVGLGSSRGGYAASVNGIGLYGTSTGTYGIWGQSTNYRGVTGRTSRSDNNYGFYTPDNLYSNNINIAGAIMQVMQNGGDVPLAPGDVVVFSGLNRLVDGMDGPIVQVSQTGLANSTAVAGVVYGRFNLDAVNPALESPDDSAPRAPEEMEVILPGSAAPGDYLLVVVQGPAEVKVATSGGDSIQPGDLLSTGSTAGAAGLAARVDLDGTESSLPGTVFAKALEPFAGSGKQGMIYVYVTLN